MEKIIGIGMFLVVLAILGGVGFQLWGRKAKSMASSTGGTVGGSHTPTDTKNNPPRTQ